MPRTSGRLESSASSDDLGLPPPRVNYRVHVGGRRRYLDLAWPDVKVAVEFDGFVPHSTRRVFDDDRARQNELVAARWTVFRVTKTMLDADPAGAFRPVATVRCAQFTGYGEERVGTGGGARSVGGQVRRSTIMAMPWPPPTHMLSRP